METGNEHQRYEPSVMEMDLTCVTSRDAVGSVIKSWCSSGKSQVSFLADVLCPRHLTLLASAPAPLRLRK